MYKETFSIWNFLSSHVSIGISQIAFPTIVLQKHDRTNSFQEERLGLPHWTMILIICVVVDESKCLDTPIVEFSIILEWVQIAPLKNLHHVWFFVDLCAHGSKTPLLHPLPPKNQKNQSIPSCLAPASICLINSSPSHCMRFPRTSLTPNPLLTTASHNLDVTLLEVFYLSDDWQTISPCKFLFDFVLWLPTSWPWSVNFKRFVTFFRRLFFLAAFTQFAFKIRTRSNHLTMFFISPQWPTNVALPFSN